jgi:cytochrome c-type biogenesis protein CcmH
MVIFWIICALMVLFTLWLVLPPLLKGESAAKGDEASAANLLVYQDQHRELEADLKNGLLSEEQYQQDKEELERRLLNDMAAGEHSRSNSKTPATRKLAYAVAIGIPVAAILFYLAIGNPKAVNIDATNQPNPAIR